MGGENPTLGGMVWLSPGLLSPMHPDINKLNFTFELEATKPPLLDSSVSR